MFTFTKIDTSLIITSLLKVKSLESSYWLLRFYLVIGPIFVQKKRKLLKASLVLPQFAIRLLFFIFLKNEPRHADLGAERSLLFQKLRITNKSLCATMIPVYSIHILFSSKSK